MRNRLRRREFIKTAAQAAAAGGICAGVASAAAPNDKKISLSGAIPSRVLGKTGVELPMLGYGGAALPTKWGNPLSLDMNEVDENWPLIRYLLDDPVYYAAYVAYVQEAMEGAFAVQPAQDRIQQSYDLIAPYVTGPDGEQPCYTHLTAEEAFGSALDELFDHVEDRQQAGVEFLAGEP